MSVDVGIFYHQIFTVSPELWVLPVWAAILLFPVVDRRRNHLGAPSLNNSLSKTPDMDINFLSSSSIVGDKAIKPHIYDGQPTSAFEHCFYFRFQTFVSIWHQIRSIIWTSRSWTPKIRTWLWNFASIASVTRITCDTNAKPRGPMEVTFVSIRFQVTDGDSHACYIRKCGSHSPRNI